LEDNTKRELEALTWFEVVVDDSTPSGLGSENLQKAVSIAQSLRSQKSSLRQLSVVDQSGIVVWREQAEFPFDISEALKSGTFTSGTSQSGKTNLNFWLANELMKNGVIVYVFDPSQAWVKKSSIPRCITLKNPLPLTCDLVNDSTIYDISRLHVDEQCEFVEKFCKTLFEARVDSEHRPKTYLMFEEAHLYFPEGCMRAKAYREALRVVTVGANFNIRFGLITQWASMVDKKIVKFPKQKYLGYSDEKNDKEYLRSFIGDRVEELETLKTGEFLYDYGKTTKRIQTPLFRASCTPQQIIQEVSLPIETPMIEKPQAPIGQAIIWLAWLGFMAWLLLR